MLASALPCIPCTFVLRKIRNCMGQRKEWCSDARTARRLRKVRRGREGEREVWMLHAQPLPLQMYGVQEISHRPTPSGHRLTVLLLQPTHSLDSARLKPSGERPSRNKAAGHCNADARDGPRRSFFGRKAPSFILLHHLASQEYSESRRGS